MSWAIKMKEKGVKNKYADNTMYNISIQTKKFIAKGTRFSVKKIGLSKLSFPMRGTLM